MRIRSPETRRESNAAIRTLEAALVAIVFGAGAYAITLFDFLFRARRFDQALLAANSGEAPEADPGTEDGQRYSPPLSFLLLAQIFYFYVYPRRERGPTRALIESLPAPILHALDRLEQTLAEPNLVSILIVVAPLLLLAALHARLTTTGLRLQGSAVRYDAILLTTCYSVGTMLVAVGLSAVVGATWTDQAVAGELRGLALAAYLLGLVVPFVVIWLRCIARHFLVVRAVSAASWPGTFGAVLGATLLLALLVAAVLALAGTRAAALPAA